MHVQPSVKDRSASTVRDATVDRRIWNLSATLKNHRQNICGIDVLILRQFIMYWKPIWLLFVNSSLLSVTQLRLCWLLKQWSDCIDILCPWRFSNTRLFHIGSIVMLLLERISQRAKGSSKCIQMFCPSTKCVLTSHTGKLCWFNPRKVKHLPTSQTRPTFCKWLQNSIALAFASKSLQSLIHWGCLVFLPICLPLSLSLSLAPQLQTSAWKSKSWE